MEPDSAPPTTTSPDLPPTGGSGARRSLPTPGRTENAAELLEQLVAEYGRNFEFLRHIGDEWFGRLFLAWEHRLERHVVFKVLRREFIHNEEARRRFEREARAAAGISHPNVVTVFWVDTLSDGTPFFVEPYTGDCTLRRRLKSVGRFQPVEVRGILSQLAAALAAAHRANIVHRGLRPDIIRCEEDTSRVLLSDFGIAGMLETAGVDEQTITQTGEVVGSAGYMSPEQMNCMRATDRSDIYSLGILGWRLLAGSDARIPVLGERTDRAALLAVAPDDPQLIDLITRCLREEPGDRPSASDVLRELDSASAGHKTAGASAARSALMDRFIPVLLITMTSGSLALVGLLSDWFQSGLRERWIMGTVIGTGFIVGMVLTWFHGKKGRQAVTRAEVAILVAIAVAFSAALAAILRWVPG